MKNSVYWLLYLAERYIGHEIFFFFFLSFTEKKDDMAIEGISVMFHLSNFSSH